MDQLKRLRVEKGLSQAKLAARAGVDPSTVNQIERGAREASPATLRKLAGALDISLVELLEADSPKAQAPRLKDEWAEWSKPRRIAALKRFRENFQHFADRWRKELEDPEQQDRYWCVGVQATAAGFTDIMSRHDMLRKIVEVAQESPVGLREEIKKGQSGRAMSDPEFVAAMDLLAAFEDMHKAADEVLEAADAAQEDWIAHAEAAQRRNAFSVIQGEMTA